LPPRLKFEFESGKVEIAKVFLLSKPCRPVFLFIFLAGKLTLEQAQFKSKLEFEFHQTINLGFDAQIKKMS
jgi:hypothetical protein